MTNPQSPQPEDDLNLTENDNNNRFSQTKVIIALGLGALFAGGYLGVKHIVTAVIPTRVEIELSRALDRDVNIGTVSSFGFSHVVIDNIEMPSTARDNSFVEVKAIRAEFNLFSFLSHKFPINITVDEVMGLGDLDTLITTVEEETPLPETIELPELPITLDINLTINEANLAITPNRDITAVDLSSKINVNFLYDNLTNLLNYDVETKVEDGNIKLKGKAELVNLTWDSRVEVTELNLASLSRFLPSLPVVLTDGRLNSSFDVSIPSLTAWQEGDLQGSLAITEVKGETIFSKSDNDVNDSDTGNNEENQQKEIVTQDFQGELFAIFNGKTINIQSARGNLGDIEGNLGGSIDVNDGYNLRGELTTVNVNEILTTLAVDLPLGVNGIVNGNLKVTGNIDNPLVSTEWVVNNTMIDNVEVGDVFVAVDGDLSEIRLSRLEVTPIAGGEIIASGLVKTNLRETMLKGEAIDINQLPVEVEYTADLFPQEITSALRLLPDNLKIGRLTSSGKITGSLSNPEGLITFNLPAIDTNTTQQVSGKGNLLLTNQEFRFTDTQLVVGEGSIDIIGNGNLDTGVWGAGLVVNNLNVTPFVSDYYQGNDISARQGTINLSGNLSSFNLDTINGDSNLTLNVAGGNTNVDVSLAKGEIRGRALVENVNLNQILSTIPVSGEIITSEVNIIGNVNQLINGNLDSLQGNLNSELNVNQGFVNLQGDFTATNLNLLGNAIGVNIDNPNLSTPIFIENSQISLAVNPQQLINQTYPNTSPKNQNSVTIPSPSQNNQQEINEIVTIDNQENDINNNLENLITALSSLKINADSRIRVAGGIINNRVDIDNQQTNITGDIQTVNLNQINPNIQASIREGNLNFSANTQEIVSILQPNLNLDSLQQITSLTGDSNLIVITPQGKIASNTNINNNLVTINATTNNLSARQLLPTFPLDANNINTQINLQANLPEIINASVNYLNQETLNTIDSLTITGKSNFNLAEGKVNLTANLNNNQWQVNVNSQGINLDNISQQLSLNLADNQPLTTSPLNSQISLQGNLNGIDINNPSMSVAITAMNLDLGENQLQGKGKFDLVNLLTNPDINNVALEINSRIDLATLPINAFLAEIPQEEGIKLLPEEINLKGITTFDGKLTANNLLTNPLGDNNFLLNGDVIASNLIVNNNAFESQLTGKLNLNPNDNLTLDLKGEKDVIYASIIPNDITSVENPNYFPYIPQRIAIQQQGEGDIYVIGEKEGEEFTLTVDNFNLASLNVAPATNYGIFGNITGKLTQNLTVNLRDFSAKGNFQFTDIGIGYVVASQLSGIFQFDSNKAQINEASLKFADTTYNLQGEYNLNTQAVAGKLNLDGNIEDIFNTLRINDVETLTAILQQIQTQDFFSSVEDITSQSVSDDNDTVAKRVNLLNRIDEEIKAIAKQIEAGGIPNNLEFDGKYQGEVILAGNLTNPYVTFDFQGDNWQWQPQQPYPNVLPQVGLVIQQNPPISIPNLTLQGDYRSGILAIKPLQLNIKDSEIYFAGNLSLDSQEGEFRFNNISLDTFSEFLPNSDFGGILDGEGKLTGNFTNPIIIGNVTLTESSYQGAILAEVIKGDFVYENYILNYNSTAPSTIQTTATLPYHPLFATPLPAKINLNLAKEAFNLLGVLTQGNITITDGNPSVNLNAEIASLNRFIENPDLNQVKLDGKLNLEDVTLNSSALAEDIKVNGELNVGGGALFTETLQAKINNTDISVNGKLPLTTADTNNETPLTVNIPNQNLTLDKLYRGGINANILVNGSLLNPLIGGFLQLERGKVSIPSPQNQNQSTAMERKIANQWLGNGENVDDGNDILQPRLDNFNIRLRDLDLEQFGLYRFLFNGDLTANGGVLKPENIRANGEVNLRRGRIYLGGATPVPMLGTSLNEQTTFFLSRSHDNKIVFRDDQGILNPEVDILMEGDVVDYSRQLINSQQNEISDPLVRGGRGETVRVELAVNGNLQSVIPLLQGDNVASCGARNNQNIPEVGWSQNNLDNIANCTNRFAINGEGADLDILDSPLVNLSSIPQRSQGEIVNLIVGGQFLGLLNQLENSGNENLLESGLLQFLLVPLLNNTTFVVNETVSTWGKPIGMKDLRVFPLVEGIYPLQGQSNVSVSYDYIYNEFKVRYQRRF